MGWGKRKKKRKEKVKRFEDAECQTLISASTHDWSRKKTCSKEGRHSSERMSKKVKERKEKEEQEKKEGRWATGVSRAPSA